MDMSNPKHPVHTDTLRSPAMQSPHESVRLNQKRGLLVADMGYPTANPGFVDVYSVKQDCRHPVLESSLPMGILGHEGGFSPDGKTFYVASLYFHSLAAVDLTNPKTPILLAATFDYQPHGVSISNDGNRLYMAEAAFDDSNGNFSGMTVLDVSQIQKRVSNPSVKIVSRVTWPQVSTPQNATPFTRVRIRRQHRRRTHHRHPEREEAVRRLQHAARGQPGEGTGRDARGRPGQRADPAVPGLPGALLHAAEPGRSQHRRVLVHHVRAARVRHP
jgi:hypothetical protein